MSLPSEEAWVSAWIDYVVSVAAGKLRPEPPHGFEAAGTRAWAAAGHFLLVEADDDRLLVRPLAGVADDGSLEADRARRPRGSRGRAGHRDPLSGVSAPFGDRS
jgi:hypothetical protein